METGGGERAAGRINDPRVPAALAYVLFIVPWLFGKQNDPFVRYHINQAFGLFLFGFLLQGVLTTLAVWASLLGIYGVQFFLVWIARIIYVVVALMGIRTAWANKEEPLRWIGTYIPSVFL